MTNRRTYSSRSNAVRAARNACKRALNAPYYQATEGPDYFIHPDGGNYLKMPWEERYYFELTGPALDASR